MAALTLGLFSKALIVLSLYFPTKIGQRSQLSIVVYKTSCWDCQDFYIGKTKRDCMTAKRNILKRSRAAVMLLLLLTTTRQPGHNLKWDHFDLLAKGRSYTHCKIKEILLIRELKPTLNHTVSSEKLYLNFISLHLLYANFLLSSFLTDLVGACRNMRNVK